MEEIITHQCAPEPSTGFHTGRKNESRTVWNLPSSGRVASFAGTSRTYKSNQGTTRNVMCLTPESREPHRSSAYFRTNMNQADVLCPEMYGHSETGDVSPDLQAAHSVQTNQQEQNKRKHDESARENFCVNGSGAVLKLTGDPVIRTGKANESRHVTCLTPSTSRRKPQTAMTARANKCSEEPVQPFPISQQRYQGSVKMMSSSVFNDDDTDDADAKVRAQQKRHQAAVPFQTRNVIKWGNDALP